MAYYLSVEFEALKNDINALFSNFHEKQSVRFEDFCQEWRNLNFACIFGATNRNTSAAKMRIVERLFRAASEFLSEESTFLYRVAAIYTFYAVYFRQITPTKVKIRMTPAMWTDLMKFLEILQEHQHYDVVYIIHTLRKHKAFTFTAFPKELCFGRIEFMIGVESFGGYKHLLERDDYANQALDNSGFLPKIKQIQNDYDHVKEKVLHESKEEEKDELSKVLFYSNSKFPEDFSKLISAHKRKYKDDNSSPKTSNDETFQRPTFSKLHNLKTLEENNSNVEKPETISRAKTISQLKNRIWSSEINDGSKSRYHVESTNTSLNNDVENGEQQPGYCIFKKSAMLQIIPSSKQPRKKLKERVKFDAKSNLPEKNLQE